jgi:pilus assembly protein FimV
MGRIQRAWPSPLDAMAELEALLFRRGAGAELFDLPAYQELLFLYQMARDLHTAEDSGGGDDVDVLLPIGGRSAPVAVPEGTIVLRPEFNDGEPVSLDLDLTTGHGDVVPPPVDDKLASLSLEHIEDPRPPEPDQDFWGSNPDARPTR